MLGTIKAGLAAGLVAILALLPMAASAQAPLSMGTGEAGTPTYTTVLAIAKAASSQAGLDLRPRPFKGTTQAVPFVNNSEIDFGLESALGLNQAFTGTGVFEGPPLDKLRLVGTIFPYRVGFVVRDGDPARTVADLKGKAVARAYRSSPNITMLTHAMLATAGLSVDDIEGLDVTTSAEVQDLFISGSLVATLGGVDQVNLPQIEQAVGPIRFLDLTEGPEAEQNARAFVPNARVVTVEPAPGRLGISRPTLVLEYDFFVYASIDTPDEAVVGIIDAMVKGKAEMVEMVPAFATLEPAKMSPEIGVPYHPAAEAHYKELGLWPVQ